jgi:hypothetical protein
MKKRTVREICLILFVFLVSSTFLSSQERKYITGRLIEEKTKEPIPFGSIRITDRALGVISNEDGSFRIPLKYREYGNIIEISSMGYITKEVSIHAFLLDTINIVMLEPALFDLDEAIVRARRKRGSRPSPEKIVQKAIDAILENYPTTPFAQVGYYRDYQIYKGNYVNLNEAIIEVVDQGFKALDFSTTNAIIYEYKENTDFPRDSLAEKPYNYKQGTKTVEKGYLSSYGGNEFVILNVHNAIRNYMVNSYSFVNRFDTDLLKNHTFSQEADTFIGNELVYTIGFEKILTNVNSYGKLFISKYDYSIFKMEYAVYDNLIGDNSTQNDKDVWNKQPISSGYGIPVGNNSAELHKYGRDSAPIFEVITEYQKQEGKLFLNYISFNNGFSVRQPPKLTMKFLELDRGEKCFVIGFSKLLHPEEGRKIKNYQVRFKNKRIKIDRLSVIDDKVFLYPKLDDQKFLLLVKEIEDNLSAVNLLSETSLKVEVNKVRDIEGNLIDDWSVKSFNQFREFLVQRVVKPVNSLSSKFFMKKDRPIFKDQPMLKPDNFDDYWMNTPLQNIDE